MLEFINPKNLQGKIGKLIIVVLLALYSSNIVYAQITNERVYFVYLYFTGDTLILDKDHAMPFEIKTFDAQSDTEIDAQEPAEEDTSTNPNSRNYRGEILSVDYKKLYVFNFDSIESRYDLTQSASSFREGKILVTAPYYPTAKDINFYDSSTGQKVLSISVEQVGQCNQNNVCESALGENWFTCLADCPAPSGTVQPADSDSNAGSIFGTILYVVGGLALAFVGWVIYRSRKNQSTGV